MRVRVRVGAPGGGTQVRVTVRVKVRVRVRVRARVGARVGVRVSGEVRVRSARRYLGKAHGLPVAVSVLPPRVPWWEVGPGSGSGSGLGRVMVGVSARTRARPYRPVDAGSYGWSGWNAGGRALWERRHDCTW